MTAFYTYLWTDFQPFLTGEYKIWYCWRHSKALLNIIFQDPNEEVKEEVAAVKTVKSIRKRNMQALFWRPEMCDLCEVVARWNMFLVKTFESTCIDQTLEDSWRHKGIQVQGSRGLEEALFKLGIYYLEKWPKIEKDKLCQYTQLHLKIEGGLETRFC